MQQGAEMKLRIEVDRLVINSGIFKVNQKGFPEEVFRLQPNKRISLKTLANVKIRYFQRSLTEILFKFYDKQPSWTLTNAVSDELKEIEDRIFEILNLYLPEDEAKLYLKRITGNSQFKKRITLALKDTGAFDDTKGYYRYYNLLLPLYQEIKKSLNTNQMNTLYYLAHFLCGCGIEKGNFKKVYETVRKFIARFESHPRGFIASYRKDPSSIIDLI